MKGAKSFSPHIKTSSSESKLPPVNTKTTNFKPITNHDDSDIEGPSEFTENLVEYVKGTKSFIPYTKTSSSATKTAHANMETTTPRAIASHDDSDIEGPSDFTENLVEYVKGTKSFIPHAKTSSCATVAADSDASEKPAKTSTTTNDSDLHAQIVRLQAQLLQKDDTINTLQTSLTDAERNSNDLQLELNQKNITIDTLQTTLKQSNHESNGLLLELNQKDITIDNLQTTLKQSNRESDGLLLELNQKVITIDTLQTTLTQSKHKSNDLQLELNQKNTTIDTLQTTLKQSNHESNDLQIELNQKDTMIDTLQTTLEQSNHQCQGLEFELHEREEKEEKREEEWHARVDLLMREVERRGAACLQLWGAAGASWGEGRAGGAEVYVQVYEEEHQGCFTLLSELLEFFCCRCLSGGFFWSFRMSVVLATAVAVAFVSGGCWGRSFPPSFFWSFCI